MTPIERSKRIMELFEAVFDLNPAERDRVLRQEADPELLMEVNALLQGKQKADAIKFLNMDDITITRDLPLVGKTIGPFYLESMLGIGGMGQVYKARHIHLDRPVAFKIPHAIHPNRDQFFERLQREGKMLARLDHPHVVKVYDAGVTEDQLPFIAMKYVEGESLSALKDRGDLSVEQVVKWGRQLAGALDYLHRHQVFHRDVKASNILIDSNGDAILADFGIAHIEEFSRITVQLPGTPAYMCPEQIQGRAVDGRCDLYSLGLVLFECLTGEQPNGLSMNIIAPHVPEFIVKAVEKCIERNPSFRHQTGAALEKALTEPEIESAVSPKLVPWIGGIGLIVLLSATLMLLMRETEPAIAPSGTTRSMAAQPTFADRLVEASSNSGDLELLLIDATRAGNLSYGSQQDFISPENCFIVVFNDTLSEAVAVLEPGGRSRRNQLTGFSIDDVEAFLANRIAIWILPTP